MGGEQILFFRRDAAMSFGFFDIGYHNSKGLRGTPFPFPQGSDRCLIGSIASQEESPQALDGHDLPILKELAGTGYRV